MGKAEIINDNGAGLYTVMVKNDDQATAFEYSGTLARLASINARIDSETDPLVIKRLKAVRFSLELRLKVLTTAKNSGFQIQAWCADLTSGLSGEVGTIEPGAEYKNGVNIQPGGKAWNAVRDGQRTPFLTMTVADAMRNFAILPGIQKYCPTYRYGIISNIDIGANTCDVTLEPVFSGIQDLDINLESFFPGVPVEYMTCNAGAFTDGDSVVVEFVDHSWDNPKVIGFKDHPKGCGGVLLIGLNSRYILWDIAANDLYSIPGVVQPLGYSTMTAKLVELGLTGKENMRAVYAASGQHGGSVVLDWSSYYAPTTSYTGEDYISWSYDKSWLEEKEAGHSLPEGETFDSEFSLNVHRKGDLYYYYEGKPEVTPRTGVYGLSVDSMMTMKDLATLGSVYAASLDPSFVDLKKSSFYIANKVLSFEKKTTAIDYNPAILEWAASYNISLSYRSQFDPSNNADNVLIVSGTCIDWACEYSIISEYNGSSKVGYASQPLKSAMAKEIFAVLEQPVIINKTTGETWGLSKLYAGIDGVQVDPSNPASPYVYDWADLIPMDMDKIFQTFGTTWAADMAARKQAAGLVVSIVN